MTTLEKQELLEKLAMLKAVLTGDLDPKDVGLKLKDEDGANRRAVAIAMVNDLGATVQESVQKDKENRPPFGFAAGRKAA
jgi:hypothetical protein